MSLFLSDLLARIVAACPHSEFEAVKAYFQCLHRYQVISSSTARQLHFPKQTGVYVVRKRNTEGFNGIYYIGLAGKMRTHVNGTRLNSGTLAQRLHRWTPYCFQTEGLYADHFEYGPNYGVDDLRKQPYDKRYCYHIPLCDVETECFITGADEKEIAPAFLEALLLQLVLQSSGNLPPANQSF